MSQTNNSVSAATTDTQHKLSRNETKITRRQALAGMAGMVGVVAAAATGSVRAQDDSPADPTKIMGAPADELGERSAFEQPQRLAVGNRPQGPNVSLSPLGDLDGIITPSDLHYEIHHNGVPEINPTAYKLLVHGMVERPMVFSLADLQRFPRVSRILFLECSGNTGGHTLQPGENDTAQTVCGLLSGVQWFGVSLATIFAEVGISPKATWALFEGMDGTVLTRSWPLDKLWWGEAMLVFGQNGEALRPSAGYPLRLIVPGTEGNANVKWLRRIEISDQPWQTRFETARYSDIRCDDDGECTVSQFSFGLDAKSVITWPSGGQTISSPGLCEIRGLAWTGRGSIARVEVSVDGGESWTLASLDQPVLPKALTRFRYPWQWNGDDTIIMSRTTDSTGYLQPSREQILERRGGGQTFYHANPIIPWRVNPDGTVTSGHF